MMAMKMARQSRLGIHLAGMSASLKQKDALRADHSACWKMMAHSMDANLAGMTVVTLANQKLKASSMASY